MISCPNCGHTVASNQRFCGNCGADVQYAQPAQPVQPLGTPISEQQSAPYAYSQPTGYGYEPYTEPPKPVAPRLILIGGVVLLAMCCACMCGLLFGFEIIPSYILPIFGAGGGAPTPRPTPRVTPTPSTMLMIVQYLIG